MRAEAEMRGIQAGFSGAVERARPQAGAPVHEGDDPGRDSTARRRHAGGQGDWLAVFRRRGRGIQRRRRVLAGREGGDAGGQIIATGTPEQVTEALDSHTGRFLKRVLTNLSEP